MTGQREIKLTKHELCIHELILQINYSELARQYGVMEKTKLGNMVVKEFLESKGVQLSRFQQFRQDKPAARRKIQRMQGGEISVPVPRTNKEIRETLMVGILCSELSKLKSTQNEFKKNCR